ncbi:hypothetical protein EV361DRAFT_866969 [Lentinula raphanica]|uniref:Uncharacterized protein n=1 Tax=Lentinula raphanica TaxID=153919 RepID=A0AA38UJ35_9AGAR|nr:hypothetical protein C8R42DRAFT_640965 [Lentinula raphanica]KAJ3822906.1 hypothetical protein F5880DRAFT_1507397 [Lentinula raphanica]KAJ3843627.1 hypothetical protein F5878DRAFT_637929 [Lentinula raphanica]KAJ3973386.1 hypothetical protein EV361DRAFT_866969 [Lentinula raphanica]
MRASFCTRLLLLAASGISLVSSLQIDVPSEWERRCEFPVTFTRETDDDPESFALGYTIEDDSQFTSFFATPTATDFTPQTVLFAIASPGVFGIEAMDVSKTAVLATTTPFSLSNSIDPCPPV